MKFSARAQMGVQKLIPKLKYTITSLKMIHTYVYNKRLKQNLRRNEGRRRIFGLPMRKNQRQQQVREEVRKSLQEALQSMLRRCFPQGLMWFEVD